MSPSAPLLFALDGDLFARGLIEVSGGDAARWLDGMVTNDIAAIAGDRPRNGCYAALLTTKGRVIADLHVLAREEGYWLETAAFAVTEVLARLGKYIGYAMLPLGLTRDGTRVRLSAEWASAAATVVPLPFVRSRAK